MNPELPAETPVPDDLPETPRPSVRLRLGWLWVCLAFSAGLGSAYLLLRGPFRTTPVAASAELASTAPGSAPASTGGVDAQAIYAQVNPPQGYTLPARYGDIGPAILEAGAIDLPAFIQLYENAGRPLTEEQLLILTRGSDQPIVISSENAYFLLNFFWAFGLTNANPILTEGPITQYGEGEIGRFASTGGWTLGTKSPVELFASAPLVTLTAEQQARLEEVAAGAYRPCCNNPTIFPDCNHGMALLGMLELMAAQDASVDEMFAAAKYINAFWFPQQAFETALYLKAAQNVDFPDADPRLVVGRGMFSASGFQTVHQSLQASGLLQQSPGQGSGCGT